MNSVQMCLTLMDKYVLGDWQADNVCGTIISMRVAVVTHYRHPFIQFHYGDRHGIGQ